MAADCSSSCPVGVPRVFPSLSPHTGQALQHKAGLLAASVGLLECLITSGNDLVFIWAGKMNFTP